MPWFQEQTTVVVLMGVASRQQWVPRLATLGYPPDLPMAWITWAGRDNQQVLRTTVGSCLKDCEHAHLHSPSVAVIGAVAQLGLDNPGAEAA
jgi:siroheme synthase